jgi:hypothetical protein
MGRGRGDNPSLVNEIWVLVNQETGFFLGGWNGEVVKDIPITFLPILFHIVLRSTR